MYELFRIMIVVVFLVFVLCSFVCVEFCCDCKEMVEFEFRVGYVVVLFEFDIKYYLIIEWEYVVN